MVEDLDEVELEELEADMKKVNEFIEDAKGRFRQLDQMESLLQTLVKSVDNLNQRVQQSFSSPSRIHIVQPVNYAPPLTKTMTMDFPRSDGDSIPSSFTTLVAEDEVHMGEAATGDDAGDPLKVEVEPTQSHTEDSCSATTLMLEAKFPSLYSELSTVPFPSLFFAEFTEVTTDLVLEAPPAILSSFMLCFVPLQYFTADFQGGKAIYDTSTMHAICLFNCSISLHVSFAGFPSLIMFFIYVFDPGVAKFVWGL